MLADEHAVRQVLRQRGVAGIGEAERRDVRAQRVVGRECAFATRSGPRRLHALIDMLAVSSCTASRRSRPRFTEVR